MKSKDEVGDLAVSYNKMIEDLRSVLGESKSLLQVLLQVVRN